MMFTSTHFRHFFASILTPKYRNRTPHICCSSSNSHISDAHLSAPLNQASLPPRRADVTDGVWDQADQRAVQQALEDADKIHKQSKKYGSGDVILARTIEEVTSLTTAHGQPSYRAKQLRDGVLSQGAKNIADITTIPKAWRQQLTDQGVKTGRSILHHEVRSPDGTRKFLLQLHDGFVVETVGIPSGRRSGSINSINGKNNMSNRKMYAGGDSSEDSGKERLTVCVSSQVGCPMRCTFCATGKGGFARNLMPHEIVDQVMTVGEMYGRRVSNVVFMGMGEPLLNLPSVIRAHQTLNQDFNIGARHITISTVGVPNSIRKLASYDLQSTLAVSIHAPTQEMREILVPSAKAYPLHALMRDCEDYFKATGRRVSYEYTLLAGVNDNPDHAHQLALLLQHYGSMKSHVNLIPWNPVDDSQFKRPTTRNVKDFVRVLEKHGVAVSVRHTRGLEAAAACGQLRNMHQKSPLQEFALPG